MVLAMGAGVQPCAGAFQGFDLQPLQEFQAGDWVTLKRFKTRRPGLTSPLTCGLDQEQQHHREAC